MATYVIGDVQGCFIELQDLLRKIKFNKMNDKLIFAGDLVNRGTHSLEVLRFIKSLKNSATVVLGNHDVYLLAVSYNYLLKSKEDTLDKILLAPDKMDLMLWLRQQNFFYLYKNHIIVHAGIAPTWSIKEAQKFSSELKIVLQKDNLFKIFMKNLFNNKINFWNNNLLLVDRWICIFNYFTRMRLCYPDGSLDFSFKGKLINIPTRLKPWFEMQNSKINNKYKIVFGHWSALNGETNNSRFVSIDTGCVWGGKLSAYCIESQKIFQVSSKNLHL